MARDITEGAGPVVGSRFDHGARQAALWRALKPHGVTTLLVFGFGDALGAGSASHGALRYLTGWNGHEAQSLWVATAEQQILLLSSPFLTLAAEEHLPEVEVIAAPLSDWGALVAARLNADGRVATIGFAEAPEAAALPLRAAPWECFAADEELAHLRMIKEDAELAALRAGAAICDDLFAALPELLRSGDPVWQIQLRQEMRARMAGAEYCRTWLTVAPVADRPRYWPEENRHCPGEGDQVLFGVALTVDGYWAHGIRMGALGAPRAEHTTLWQITERALVAGQARLIPGAEVAAAEAAMSRIVTSDARKSGWPLFARFRGGHGLGTSYEEPVLSAQFPQHWGPEAFRAPAPSPLAVAPGMVFEVHPNLFVPDVGAAALGEMLVIEDHGATPLLQTPRGLFSA